MTESRDVLEAQAVVEAAAPARLFTATVRTAASRSWSSPWHRSRHARTGHGPPPRCSGRVWAPPILAHAPGAHHGLHLGHDFTGRFRHHDAVADHTLDGHAAELLLQIGGGPVILDLEFALQLRDGPRDHPAGRSGPPEAGRGPEPTRVKAPGIPVIRAWRALLPRAFLSLTKEEGPAPSLLET